MQIENGALKDKAGSVAQRAELKVNDRGYSVYARNYL